MKPISRSSKAEAFHKYLKPGALAQLRDSKINARSSRINSIRLDLVPIQIPSQTQIQISDFEQIPRFLNKIYGGPCCLQRKKLWASKSVLLVNLEASGQHLGSRESSSRNGENLLINAIDTDVVIAH
ncbi:hypothetical protein PTKIN_Ptkin11bG0183000 [Pterospermum kingtungense]